MEIFYLFFSINSGGRMFLLCSLERTGTFHRFPVITTPVGGERQRQCEDNVLCGGKSVHWPFQELSQLFCIPVSLTRSRQTRIIYEGVLVTESSPCFPGRCCCLPQLSAPNLVLPPPPPHPPTPHSIALSADLHTASLVRGNMFPLFFI